MYGVTDQVMYMYEYMYILLKKDYFITSLFLLIGYSMIIVIPIIVND